jgi:hypothetical protein
MWKPKSVIPAKAGIQAFQSLKVLKTEKRALLPASPVIPTKLSPNYLLIRPNLSSSQSPNRETPKDDPPGLLLSGGTLGLFLTTLSCGGL